MIPYDVSLHQRRKECTDVLYIHPCVRLCDISRDSGTVSHNGKTIKLLLWYSAMQESDQMSVGSETYVYLGPGPGGGGPAGPLRPGPGGPGGPRGPGEPGAGGAGPRGPGLLASALIQSAALSATAYTRLCMFALGSSGKTLASTILKLLTP